MPPTDSSLVRAFHEAITDHGQDHAKLPIAPKPVVSPLKFTMKSGEEQGKRPTMEDYHFHEEIREGLLMGVFDGHGDKGAISKFAGLSFLLEFSAKLKERFYDVKAVCTELCTKIHQEITQKIGGTTALICFFDKVNHQLHTATLGDSEAKIYRMVDGKIFSIPLSCTRNWKHREEAKRAAAAYKKPEMEEQFTSAPDPKQIYFPQRHFGVNVSRTLGDKSMVVDGVSAISQEPLVSSHQVLPDDLVVLACDGLWDFVQDEEKFIDQVIRPHWKNPNIYRAILDYALKTSTDNVTIVTGWVSADLKSPDLTLSLSQESTQPFDL